MNDVALPRARTQSPSPRRRARWLRVAPALLLVPVLLLTVALPVLLGTLAALVMLSPLLLLGWLLWRAARPGPPRMQAP